MKKLMPIFGAANLMRDKGYDLNGVTVPHMISVRAQTLESFFKAVRSYTSTVSVAAHAMHSVVASGAVASVAMTGTAPVHSSDSAADAPGKKAGYRIVNRLTA